MGGAMKIWIKLLVGSLIGLAGRVSSSPCQAQGFFDSLSGLLIGIGRYVLFPFIFFSLGIGTSELRQEKRLVRVYLSAFKYLAARRGAPDRHRHPVRSRLPPRADPHHDDRGGEGIHRR